MTDKNAVMLALAPKLAKRLAEDFEFDIDGRAAVIGNLAWECDRFCTLQEIKPVVAGSKGGFGWAQWTGPRRREYEAWCKRKGWRGDEFEANYSFLFRELVGSEARAVTAVKAAKGLEAKTRAFMTTYLRPGIPHLEGRIALARAVVQAISDPPGDQGSQVASSAVLEAPGAAPAAPPPPPDVEPVAPSPEWGGKPPPGSRLVAWLKGAFS